MVKDYKVTSMVNKEQYLKFRGILMMEGVSFSDWLNNEIEKEIPFPTDKPYENRWVSERLAAKIEEFHPVPKPGKKWYNLTMAKNANIVHQAKLGVNDKIAIGITKVVATMWAAYVFAGLAFVALPAAIAQGSLTVLVNWVSSNFLQLVLLPLIMVGQDLQGRHAETRAELDFETNTKAEAEIEKILKRLDEQDKQILKIVEKL